MVEDVDVWRAAKLLVDRHGDEAPAHAAMRADELLADGNLEGQRTWKRILSAIDELLRGRSDDPLH